MKTTTRKVLTAAVITVAIATATACSTSSEPAGGGEVGVDALGANTSNYVTQVRSFATTEGHMPQTQAELDKALGGQKLPNAQLKVEYLYNPANPEAFCFISTSVNTVAVYDSAQGGNQPATTKTCSAGFVPLSTETTTTTDPLTNPGGLLSR